ncbi:hypothetical protein [Levilactobacillus enshiensis]|uniref:hypothetical protein n=1 Tax=Levilactobacillus enshiensis TaxID=2590213 RepID=UPI00117A720C|nr:hypothetical protein [Levilactobacillus enshiensis]
MEYLRVRISKETAQIFQALRDVYEQAYGKPMTQAMIISKALDDISNLSRWDKVINNTSASIKTLKEITEKDLRIRVQLSPQMQETIQNYKYYLPQFAGTRSITLGVTLKFIFKGAMLVQNDSTLLDSESRDIGSILSDCESRLAELIAPTNKDTFESLFKELKHEILALKK